ncbi:MAG TPA: hypothetical protein VGN08_09870 [Solirubrobacteraceae bacterium]|jgi:hypothetical protein
MDTPTEDRPGAPADASERPVTDATGGARLLSPRVTAALAAAMLGIGVAVGAAIGPSPSTSFAGPSGLLLHSLLAGVAPGGSPSPAPAAKEAEPVTPASQSAAPVPSAQPAPASTTSPAATTQPASSPAPAAAPEPAPKTSAVPPATSVWLIELAGSTFTQALGEPASAPYITGQAVPSGSLLSGWSAAAGAAFADETALIAGSPPQLVNTIVEPPCPEGTAGAACTEGTPGALKSADEFLRQTIATITSGSTYREHGLIVVTFASIAAGTASGLPAGSTRATLTSQPPVGALVISPFATAGARPALAFDPTSPEQSIEKVLHR